MNAQPAEQPRQQQQGPPSTSSVLWAEWRRGLKDLQNIVLNPWQGYAATHEEPGTVANPTNIEVYRNRHQDSAYPQVSVRNEVSMPTQPSAPSPADLVERTVNGPTQGQQQSEPEISPADLVEGRMSGPAQGQQQQSRPEVSPADLSEGNGVSPQQQQQQAQRQGQSHGVSM